MSEEFQPVDELVKACDTFVVRFEGQDFATASVLLKALEDDALNQRPFLDTFSVFQHNAVRTFTGG
jgi:hypothetical protein